MSEGRIIKKYPNRRLYDTAVSRYVALEDIRRLVMDQVPFQVVDAKTGEDLTRSLLLQIISEQEQHGQPIFSTELLERIIRFYGDALQGFMGSYLERSMDLFMRQQQTFQRQMQALLDTAPLSALTEMAERNLSMWKGMQEELYRAYRGVGSPTPDSDDEGK
jgi:polyhydroxyalkanoate synthesis repressor PhaR